jgi:hypothetical protein
MKINRCGTIGRAFSRGRDVAAYRCRITDLPANLPTKYRQARAPRPTLSIQAVSNDPTTVDGAMRHVH